MANVVRLASSGVFYEDLAGKFSSIHDTFLKMPALMQVLKQDIAPFRKINNSIPFLHDVLLYWEMLALILAVLGQSSRWFRFVL